MNSQPYLIAPARADAQTLLKTFERALAAGPVAALLIPRLGRTDNEYEPDIRTLLPHALAHRTAVLVEGPPELVRRLGVDGLHVSGGPGAVLGAVKALKPDFIVGAGNVHSRHEAMEVAEAGADYILFGPLSGRIAPAQRELARWWSQMMEIPAVLSDPDAAAGEVDAAGCEFVAFALSPEAAA